MKPSKALLPFLTAFAVVSFPLQAATINLDLTTNNPDPITLDPGSNTFSFTGFSVDYLIVGGGGGGGGSTTSANSTSGGGGGAGGMLTGNTTITGSQSITVGAGGAGGAAGTNSGSKSGNKGSDSVAFTLTAEGGGFGAKYDANGGSGGSGGGAGARSGTAGASGGSGTAGQGNDGGSRPLISGSNGAAGGGGAGGAGSDVIANGTGRAGGAGLANSITGSSITYATGGNGGSVSGGTSSNAASNTGNGGTGGGAAGGSGGAGGSGIVVVSYFGSQVLAGGIVSTVGGNTVHQFTSTGSSTLDLRSATIAGNISGAGNLIWDKTGTLTLSGTNSYTGTTTVNGGTLLVNGDSSAATNTVTVNNTATLGGSGTLGGNVTMTASANLAPGASAGTLSIGGNLTISALAGGDGKLNFELGANSALSSDKIAVTGTLTIGIDALGFADFDFTALSGLQNGTYKLITSGAAVSGTLDDDNLSGAVGTGTGTLQISDGGTGNDIELVVSGIGVGSPYDTWATGGELFGDDANNDGVSNGVAFLLGASSPTISALDKLPTVTETAGGLVLNFSMLNTDNRGTTALAIEHSNSLAADSWTTVSVPDTAGETTVGAVTFNVTLDSPLNTVTATISSSAAAAGKLFGRLKATE